MASNSSVDSNDALHTNVRVKIEPGTSESSTPSTSSVTSVPLSERVANIKMEPGLPSLPITTQRLPSFRLPRDLTLGGNIKTEKPKKIYTPNLNVQRNKKKDDPVKNEPVKLRSSDRGKERGRGDRGRGRGDKGNIIQSIGVWSEGIYSAPTTSRKSDGPRASSSTVGAAKYLQKPKLDTNKITNKTVEEKKLKTLLRDDFNDDDPDADDKTYPLILPRIKKNTQDNDIIHNDKTNEKPVILENGEIVNMKKGNKQDKKADLTIPQIIENKANSYTLIQFPESLPGLEVSREEVGSKSNDTNENNSKAKTERCIINSLRSGLLGKLEILKSGKARLRLGETSFFVDIGAQQCFQQDLLAVKVDATSQSGDLINLGPVNNKLICSPDFESMLKNS